MAKEFLQQGKKEEPPASVIMPALYTGSMPGIPINRFWNALHMNFSIALPSDLICSSIRTYSNKSYGKQLIKRIICSFSYTLTASSCSLALHSNVRGISKFDLAFAIKVQKATLSDQLSWGPLFPNSLPGIPRTSAQKTNITVMSCDQGCLSGQILLVNTTI